ncbi:MAG: N-acetylglucosamine-6-phosphate deacetylase [Coriobacteriales bacterium]
MDSGNACDDRPVAAGDEAKTVSGIRGTAVFDGRRFVPAYVPIEGGRFLDPRPVGEGEPETTGPDADGLSTDATLEVPDGFVIPGLVDIHFHGCMDRDFSDGDLAGLHEIAAFEASQGVTAICPASMTLPTDVLDQAMRAAARFVPVQGESSLVGINMEGPYISPDKVGAQNPAYVRPASLEEFAGLQEASGGLIRLIDLAPEIPGNLDFVREVAAGAAAGAFAGKQLGVRVSIAHTATDYDCAARAFELGARHMTHLYNAMPKLQHRAPGPIAAGAERDDVSAELIADGVHVHPSMVRLAFNMFGAERICLISDSLRACGLGDGTYELGGQLFTVAGPRATIENGSLAGSVSTLMQCMRTAVTKMGIPLALAVRAASANPARAIGVDALHGSIAAGHVADAVVLNRDLSVRHVVVRGRLVR